MLNDFPKFWLRKLVSVCCLVAVSHLLCEPRVAEARGHSLSLTNSPICSESLVVTQPYVRLISERASSKMVGTIMALLAIFDEAGILPPEGTAQANQVIHGLIQLQSTLMKSNSTELADYQMAAETFWASQHQDMQDGALQEEGLTLRVLEALIAHDQEHPMWNDQKIVSAMQGFNVSHADWLFIVQLFNKANVVFRDQGRSIHTVYNAWRLKFPGSKS